MQYLSITRAQNPAVKHLVKLRDRRTRDAEGVTLLEGYRELTRAAEYGMKLSEVYFSPEHFLGVNEFALLERFDAAYEKGMFDGLFSTNLIYQMPELLARPWYHSVDMSKYIAYIINILNHDASISPLLNPYQRISQLLERHELDLLRRDKQAHNS